MSARWARSSSDESRSWTYQRREIRCLCTTLSVRNGVYVTSVSHWRSFSLQTSADESFEWWLLRAAAGYVGDKSPR
jgi:hypothetical protein